MHRTRLSVRMTAMLLAVAAAATFTGCRSGRTPSGGGSDASSVVSTDGRQENTTGRDGTGSGENEGTTMNEQSQTTAAADHTGGRQTTGTAAAGSTATVTRTTGSTTDDTPDANDSYAFDGDPNTLWTAPSFGTTVLTYRPKQAITFNTVRFKERGDRIDNNKYIQLVRIGESYFAIAVCKDTVTNLGEIPAGQLKDKTTTDNTSGFRELLKRAAKKENEEQDH